MTRYISKHIVQSTLLVFSIVTGIEIFILFFNEMHNIRTGYTAWYAFLIVVMQASEPIYQMFPMILFFGCLLGCGTLSSSGELTMMRASGMSFSELWCSMAPICVAMIVCMTWFGEMGIPNVQGTAERMKNTALGDSQHAHGFWLRYHQDFMYIRSLEAHTLYGIYWFHILNGRIDRWDFAPRADQVSNGWNMGTLYSKHFHNMRIDSHVLHNILLDRSLNAWVSARGRLDANQWSVVQLYGALRDAQKLHIDSGFLSFFFWQRVLRPLLDVVMFSLSIPFVLTVPRRDGAGIRMVIGMCVGFIFYVLNQVLEPITLINQWNPFWTGSIPIFLSFIVFFVLRNKIKM